MAEITPINIGTIPNDGTGDSLRAAGDKINTNLSNLNNDARFTDQRTPTDASVTYEKVASSLVGRTTVNSAIDLSANSIGSIVLSEDTSFSFTNYKLSKSYILIITPNGFLPSFATPARHIIADGSVAFDTATTVYVSMVCIDDTEGSEKLLTSIIIETPTTTTTTTSA